MYDQISKYVDEHEDELVELHRQLVKTPSAHPSPDYSKIRELIVNEMEKIGLKVKLVGIKGKENILGRLEGISEKSILMFHSHMDTTPVGDIAKWERHPFSAILENNTIFGLGASDAKNSVVAMLMAAKALKELDIPLHRSVLFVIVVDEEIGSKDGMINLVNSGVLEGIEYSVMCAMIGWKIPVVMRGILTVKLKTFGKSQHPGDRPEGYPVGTPPQNAIHDMVKILNAIQDIDHWMTYKIHPKLGPQGIEDSWTNKPIVTASVIKGGVKSNVVPDSCEVQIDMRIVPGQTSAGVKKELKTLIEKLGIRAEIESSEDVIDPIETTEDSPLIKVSQEVAKIVTGKMGQICGFVSSAEVCHLIPLGISAIKFGAEGGKNLHSPNECVEVQSLLDHSKAFAILAAKLLNP